ncbi:MAG: hypothetical protein ACLUOI_10825 [Eisenbergiella sp.]
METDGFTAGLSGNDFIQVESFNGGHWRDIFDRGMLPSDVKNTDEDMERVIGIVRGCFNYCFDMEK